VAKPGKSRKKRGALFSFALGAFTFFALVFLRDPALFFHFALAKKSGRPPLVSILLTIMPSYNFSSSSANFR
jgi:hypothetical protein